MKIDDRARDMRTCCAIPVIHTTARAIRERMTMSRCGSLPLLRAAKRAADRSSRKKAAIAITNEGMAVRMKSASQNAART